MKKNFKNNAGYTIIETMIAVSLFLVVVMTGMGALLNANLLHQKSRDMRSIMDNLSFIMEDMSRNLRTGYDYRCADGSDGLGANIGTAKSSSVDANDISQSCFVIAFKSALDGGQWVYYIDSNKIFKSTQSPYSFPADYIQLTPDEIMIDNNFNTSGFVILGAEPPETPLSPTEQQPFVTIRLVGTITSKGITTPFSLQTSVSQRNIDI